MTRAALNRAAVGVWASIPECANVSSLQPNTMNRCRRDASECVLFRIKRMPTVR
jgi:hypothetical protein